VEEQGKHGEGRKRYISDGERGETKQGKEGDNNKNK
jgi:hypothetical protein